MNTEELIINIDKIKKGVITVTAIASTETLKKQELLNENSIIALGDTTTVFRAELTIIGKDTSFTLNPFIDRELKEKLQLQDTDKALLIQNAITKPAFRGEGIAYHTLQKIIERFNLENVMYHHVTHYKTDKFEVAEFEDKASVGLLNKLGFKEVQKYNNDITLYVLKR